MFTFSWIWYSFAAAIVLLIPGGALLAWLPEEACRKVEGLPADSRTGENQRVRRPLPSTLARMADSAALSISISALLALVLFVLGWRVSSLALGFLYGVSLAALLVAAFVRLPGIPPRTLVFRRIGQVLLALGFFCLLAAWRLYQARSLALPAWVDSVHHTLIVQLILERGMLPADFMPYVPAPFFYHFGFHVITALFTFWSGLPPDQAVLWFGQILNAAVALSVYRAAEALRVRMVEQAGGMERALAWFPALAALLVGFVFQMPAYYLTWGRYTLLAGLVLLGPLLSAAMDAWDAPWQKGAWIRLVLLVGGLALTHYFALLLAALFLLVLGIFGMAVWLRRRAGWEFLWRLAFFSLMGLLLAAPWLYRIYLYSHTNTGVTLVSPLAEDESARQGALNYLRYIGYLVGPRRNHILLGMAAVGLLAALRHPHRRPLVLWSVLLALFTMPWGIRFNPFRPDYFAIVLFFPAALLLAGLLFDGAAAVAKLARPWSMHLVLVVVAALFLAWGIRDTRSILNPVTIFANQADVNALNWVREHTPADARFFTNTAAWQGEAYRGVDGGFWLVPYTGRMSLIPPVVYGWGPPEYVQQILRWAQQAAAIKGCTPEFWNLVHEAQLTYVYLRQGQGSLQPDAVQQCTQLQKVYQQDGVSIYQILPPK